MDLPASRESRTERIAASLSGLIAAGTIEPGERLPSIRRAAERHGVSKNTMAEVYDRLVASGHLEAEFVGRHHIGQRPRRRPYSGGRRMSRQPPTSSRCCARSSISITR